MTTMDVSAHGTFRALAAAAVDGRLSPEEAIALEAHLTGCAECRALLGALTRDHQWLAEPGSYGEPPARIRAVVLGAARAPRRASNARSTWVMLVAASLVIAIGVAVSLGLRKPSDVGVLPSPSTSASTAGPSRSSTQSPTSPSGRGEAHLVATGPDAGGAFDFSIDVSGGIFARPVGSLAFASASGGSWQGTITSVGYWVESSTGRYGMFVQGCVVGPGCTRYALQLVDLPGGGQVDEVRLSFPTVDRPDVTNWESTYRLDGGSIEIVGDVSRLDTARLPAASDRPAPSGTMPWTDAAGRLMRSDVAGGQLDLEGRVVGGRDELPRGSLTFADAEGRSWTLAVLSADYWHDETGSATGLGAYVTLIQGCVGRDPCTPLAAVLVDRREVGGADTAGLAWGWTRPTGETGGEYQQYNLESGSIEIDGCMSIVVSGAMLSRHPASLCGP